MPNPDDRRPRFDRQATAFDRRAGLPASARSRIADAIVAIADLAAGQRVLDVGAGTGEITVELVERGLDCVALDESPRMLDLLRRKTFGSPRAPTLFVADAAEPWPVPDRSVSLVFGSRSFHWLPAEHVCREALRVSAGDGASLLIGRVARDPGGMRAKMRDKMRELLRASGFPGKSGARSATDLVGACVAAGGAPIPGRVVASWTLRATPRSLLEDWRGMDGVGGSDVPDDVKSDVLERVDAWAREAFGDIGRTMEFEECYTLEGAILVPRKRRDP